MEKWRVVGVDRDTSRTIKAENKTVRGIALYLLGAAPDNSGRYLGQVVREQFLSNERLGRLNVQPMPGDDITLHFNRFGDVCQIDVVRPQTGDHHE